MTRKRVVSLVVALMLTFGIGSTVFAAVTTVTIPSLNYFIQQYVTQNDQVTFVYKNTTGSTQMAVFRISNVNYNDNGTGEVAGKLTGSYSMLLPNGSVVPLGTFGGGNLAGGIGNLAPNSSFVVQVKAAPGISSTAFKIKFDPQ